MSTLFTGTLAKNVSQNSLNSRMTESMEYSREGVKQSVPIHWDSLGLKLNIPGDIGNTGAKEPSGRIQARSQ